MPKCLPFRSTSTGRRFTFPAAFSTSAMDIPKAPCAEVQLCFYQDETGASSGCIPVTVSIHICALVLKNEEFAQQIEQVVLKLSYEREQLRIHGNDPTDRLV